MDVRRGVDVSEAFRADNGDIDLLGGSGLDSVMTRRLLRCTAADLQTSSHHDEVIRRLGATTPILGVCLGHQCMGQVYGGVVSRAPRLMHGKTSSVYHNGQGLFNGVPSPFTATRYHSLIVEEALPEALAVTAFTRDGEVMGLQHRDYPVVGVQFHPESILTEHGKRILQNFLNM